MADKLFETIKTVVIQVNFVSQQCAFPHQITFNWLPTCNLIMYWKLEVSLNRSHSEGLDDIQGIILQFKMISNKVPRHGNICVHSQKCLLPNHGRWHMFEFKGKLPPTLQYKYHNIHLAYNCSLHKCLQFYFWQMILVLTGKGIVITETNIPAPLLRQG